MKKITSKILITVNSAFLLVVTVGCGNSKHSHTFEKEWTTNEIYHWHVATCEHSDLVSEKAEHNFNEERRCTICGYKSKIPAQYFELPEEVEEYYAPLKDNIHTGEEFLKDLREFNNQKRTSYIGYSGTKTEYIYTDVDPLERENPKVISFYTNSVIENEWDSGATWNREHVWPESRGGGPKSKIKNGGTYIEDDFHMPRPTLLSDNSKRGNSLYSEDAFDPGYKILNYRGIAARIIFYCAMSDEDLMIEDRSEISNTDANYRHSMGKLSELLKWNVDYLPSQLSTAPLELRVEQNRNNVIANKYQGNRNPFIDHPEYAERIWG